MIYVSILKYIKKHRNFVRLANCKAELTKRQKLINRVITQEEFREWSEDMSPRLVTMLDVLRFRFGRPIAISASEYAA